MGQTNECYMQLNMQLFRVIGLGKKETNIDLNSS